MSEQRVLVLRNGFIGTCALAALDPGDAIHVFGPLGNGFRLDVRRPLLEVVDGRPIQNARKTMKDIPAVTKESDAMSKDLKKRGFRFVGTTICYAYMQACGLVNDHVLSCFRHDECAALG